MHVRQDVPRVVGLQSAAGITRVRIWPKIGDFTNPHRFRKFRASSSIRFLDFQRTERLPPLLLMRVLHQALLRLTKAHDL